MAVLRANGEEIANPERLNRLRELVESLCLEEGDFTLSTGRHSKYYFDCKKAMLDGGCLALIADAFLKEAGRLEPVPTAIGGLTIGADFIVAAVIMRAAQIGHPMRHGLIVRKEPKEHGTQRYIENETTTGARVMVVDDVITTGGSTRLACERLRDAGYQIAGIVALVDREAGGREGLAAFTPHIRGIFKKSDFPRLRQHGEDDADAPTRALVHA